MVHNCSTSGTNVKSHMDPRSGTLTDVYIHVYPLRKSLYHLVNVYIAMENHHSKWDNSAFLWPCSTDMLVITRVFFDIYIYMII